MTAGEIPMEKIIFQQNSLQSVNKNNLLLFIEELVPAIIRITKKQKITSVYNKPFCTQPPNHTEYFTWQSI